MPIADPTVLQSQLAARLTRRADELRELLAAAQEVPQDTADVVDFKDVAAQDTRAAVDDVALAHANDELGQVLAALRRLDEGTYGQCQDCGETIDQRRLAALPATPYCTACQAIHERPWARR